MIKPLLLPSLKIRNFRAFEDLKISTLGRVNLIVGNNNVGKTSLLEAVWLWASRGDWDVVQKIMQARDENIVADPDLQEYHSNGELNSLKYLFSDYPDFSSTLLKEKEIEFEISAVSYEEYLNKNLRFRIANIDDGVKKGWFDRKKEFFYRDQVDYQICLYMSFGNLGCTLVTSLNTMKVNTSEWTNTLKPLRCPTCFVSSADDNRSHLRQMWDRAQMNSEDQKVLSELEVIFGTQIEKIFFLTFQNNSLIPMCKLRTNGLVIPLRNLGGGVIRVFEILLAMVNSQGGVLLIDEFENGLHYKIQPKAWEVIFEMAERLNVQVFATTHSADAVRSFEQMAMQRQDEKAGVVVQLTRFSKGIVANPLYGDNIRLMYDCEEDLR
ncbi:MAG: AAA family ATPase [Planctomycetaceae bacterium]|nr:AAA family ATPase [Planctomycetaceae bacterium]